MKPTTEKANQQSLAEKAIDRQGAIVLAFGWAVALLVTLT